MFVPEAFNKQHLREMNMFDTYLPDDLQDDSPVEVHLKGEHRPE